MLLTLLVTTCLLTGAPADSLNPFDTTQPPIGSIILTADSAITPGDTFSVSLALADSTVEVGGFNFLIEYDYGSLVFDSATFGELTQGEWEYFQYRPDLSEQKDTTDPRGYLRLVGIADMYDVEGSPSPRSMVGPGELVRLFFYAADKLANKEQTVELKFLWQKCGDNSISDASGNRLYLSHQVFDGKGDLMEKGPVEYLGASTGCFRSTVNPPAKAFDFHNLQIKAAANQ
jgi:hypothetical protein